MNNFLNNFIRGIITIFSFMITVKSQTLINELLKLDKNIFLTNENVEILSSDQSFGPEQYVDSIYLKSIDSLFNMTHYNLSSVVGDVKPEFYCHNKEWFNVLKENGYTDKNQQCILYSQLMRESKCFKIRDESSTGDCYDGSISLMNYCVGDGHNLRGLGGIQLTGRENFRKFQNKSRLIVKGIRRLFKRGVKIKNTKCSYKKHNCGDDETLITNKSGSFNICLSPKENRQHTRLANKYKRIHDLWIANLIKSKQTKLLGQLNKDCEDIIKRDTIDPILSSSWYLFKSGKINKNMDILITTKRILGAIVKCDIDIRLAYYYSCLKANTMISPITDNLVDFSNCKKFNKWLLKEFKMDFVRIRRV